jgi:small-conductance mechanosensitive channel
VTLADAYKNYAKTQEELNSLDKYKSQITKKLDGLVTDDLQDNEARRSAHDTAVQAYSDAIAAGDSDAERASDMQLQSLLGESDKQRGKRLARTAAITKLRGEISEIDQKLDNATKQVESAHKALLIEIMYKRAEIVRAAVAELVEAAKKHKEAAYSLGLGSCLQDIKIPLPATHALDRYDCIGSHSIRIEAKNMSIEYLLSN